MSQDLQDKQPSSRRAEHPERPRRMVLAGLLIIAISVGAWFGIHWYSAIIELRAVKQELQRTQLELTNAKQFLEAQRLINRRQAEMLRATMETPSTP